MADAPRVFLSYSHDSDEHAARVLALADALCDRGIDVVLDRYVHPAPAEGWPLWMERNLDAADFVLMVCTVTYRRRVLGRKKPGRGLGVRWEGNLISNRIYHDQPSGSRFIPILLPGSKPAHIPGPVQGHSYYRIATLDLTDSGFEALYRHLTDQPATPRPGLGSIQILSPKPRPQAVPGPLPPSGGPMTHEVDVQMIQTTRSPQADFHNPYDFASVAIKEMFKGRDEEINELLDAVESGTHATVFGLQRMGKTSLVEEVLVDRLDQRPSLKDAVLFVHVDFQRLGSEYPTYKDVFHAIVEAVSERLVMIGRGRRVDGGLRGAVNEFFASANRYERGSKAQIFFDFAKVLSRTAESAGRKVVLFLDEFSEVRKVIERNEALNYRNPGRYEKIHPHEMLVDISFMHYFSSLLKSSELKQKIVFILAVRPFMSEYDEKKELQVLKLTTPITLYYLDEDAAKELINDPLRGKVDYEVGANDYLYRLTAGHPYLIQFILKTVVDRIRREGRATIALKDIKDVEEKMIAEGPAYDAHFAVIDSDYSVDEVLKEAWALLGRGTLALIAKFGDNQTERWVSSDAICQELKRYNINRADVHAMLSQLVRAKILEEELLNGDLYFRITMPLLHERYVKQNIYKKYFNIKISSKL